MLTTAQGHKGDADGQGQPPRAEGDQTIPGARSTGDPTPAGGGYMEPAGFVADTKRAWLVIPAELVAESAVDMRAWIRREMGW